jgi:putative transposase
LPDDDHLLCVLRYIEANPVRAKMVTTARDYRWSSFAAHGQGEANDLLDPVPAYESLAAYPAVCRRRWTAYVHQTPSEAEAVAIRRSNETGLPFDELTWVRRLRSTSRSFRARTLEPKTASSSRPTPTAICTSRIISRSTG